jgi:hypothetical protein
MRDTLQNIVNNNVSKFGNVFHIFLICKEKPNIFLLFICLVLLSVYHRIYHEALLDVVGCKNGNVILYKTCSLLNTIFTCVPYD